MCRFRPAFAVLLDCAATRAGDSAPGQTVQVSRMGSPSCLRNTPRNYAKSLDVDRRTTRLLMADNCSITGIWR
jgi:hypothetical protein